jgi:hypothetical protein
MGPLEQRVTELMERAINADPTMLATMTAMDDPNRELTQEEMNGLFWSAWGGSRDAILHIAREIDQAREA